MVGVALVAAARHAADVGGPATPNAARELADAIALLRTAATELGNHPAAAQLHQATTKCERASIGAASKILGTLVRDVHPKLREELGLVDTPPLTNWTVNDAEDDTALQAAGLGLRTRAVRIAMVVLAVVAFYVVLFTR